MPDATITVAFIDPPAKPRVAGGKLPPWRIKDTNGDKWKVWDSDFRAFGLDPEQSKGKTFVIQFKPGEYEGKPDNTIIDVKREMPQSQIPIPQVTVPPVGTPAVRYEDRSEDISVLALIKCVPDFGVAAANGDVKSGVQLLRTCRQIWREYKRPAPAPTPIARPSHKDVEPELNDEIDIGDRIPY